jgi:hypothetical protein
LLIAEKWNDQLLSVDSYNVMGVITLQEDDLAASEQWFRKALPIAEQTKMYRELVFCYRHLGILAARNGRFIESGEWLIKARLTAGGLGDTELVAITSHNFAVTYEHADPECQVSLANMWRETGLGIPPTNSTDAAQHGTGAPGPPSESLS